MSHSRLIGIAWAVLSSLHGIAAAQDLPDQGLAAAHDRNFGPGALVVVDAAQQSVTTVTGLPAELARPFAVADDPYRRDVYFVGTDGRTPTGIVGTNVFAVTLRSGRFISRSRLTPQPLAEDTLVSIELIGNQLLVLGRRSLMVLPVGGGTPTTLAQFGGGNEGRAMASDGRYAYVAINNRDIVRIDLYGGGAQPLWVRVPGGFISAILSLHVSGDSLFVGTGDPLLGGEIQEYRLSDATRMARVSAGFSAVAAIGGNERNGDLFLAGPSASGGNADALTTYNGGSFGSTFGAISLDVVSVTINRAPSIMRFGQPCADSTGNEPRIRAISPPRIGNAGFGLGVKTRPGSLAILAGQDRTNPWVLPAATDMGRFGAPGCQLLLLPIATAATITNGTGTGVVSLPIPNQPSLLGGMMDFQFVVLDRTVNRLGMAFSQAGSVIVSN